MTGSVNPSTTPPPASAGRSSGRRLFRMNLVMLTITVALLVAVVLYADSISKKEFQRQQQDVVQSRLSAIRAKLEGQLSTNLSAVQGLVTILELEPDIDQARFQRFAQPLLEKAPLLTRVSAAPNLVVAHVYPFETNKYMLGMSLAESPMRQQAVSRLEESGMPVVAGPLPLRNGGSGLIMRFPVYTSVEGQPRQFWGLLSAVMDNDEFFNLAGLNAEDLELDLAIRNQDSQGNDGPIFYGDHRVFGRTPVEATVMLPAGSWHLAATPKGGWPTRAGFSNWLWAAMGLVGMALLLPVAIMLRNQREQNYQWELIESLFQLSPLGIALNDLETGRTLDANQALLDLVGYSREQLLQKHFREFTPEEYLPMEREQLHSMEQTGRYGPYEKEFIRSDGSRIPVRLNGMFIQGTQGRKRFWSIVDDISTRRKIELEQEQSARHNKALAELTVNPAVLQGELELVKQELVIRMALALDVARASLWLHSEDGNEMHCIALFEQKTESFSEGAVLKREDYPHYFSAMEQNAHVAVKDACNDPCTSEFRIGYLEPLGITSMLDAVIPGGNGIVGVLCAEHIGPMRDWTQAEESFVISLASLVGGVYASYQRQQAESALVQAKRQAESAARAKSDFLATMSHEIRTPMNGVLGMLNLLSNPQLDEAQQRKVNIARSSATALLALLDDVLDFSKVDAGKLELESVDFDLRSLLEDLAASMALAAQEKGLELVLDLAGVGVSRVRGDPDRLRQIFSNLISNAIKFTREGEVMVRCQLQAEPEGYRMLAQVVDSGVGIPIEKQSKLFSPFVQVDTSTTRKYGGTGLGLAICKKLCELMGGTIEVRSDVGEGSVFLFSAYLQASENSAQVTADCNVEGVSILVVDSNRRCGNALADQFKAWGVHTAVAASGAEALQACKTTSQARSDHRSFSLALISQQLTDMSGLDLGHVLRSDLATSSLPLVMTTTLRGGNDPERLGKAGYCGYFHKPATTGQLQEVIRVASTAPADEGRARLLLGQAALAESRASDQAAIQWPAETRILLVEDNKINQEVAILLLDDLGLKVDVAENGLLALATLCRAENAYSLILMDCQMPEMDGFQATRCIREGQAGPGYTTVPILALTANAIKGDRERCLDVGMNDYLTKPIDDVRLRQLLLKYINGKEIVPVAADSAAEAPDIDNDCDWDRVAALKMVRGRQDRLQDLLKTFSESMPERMDKLEQALSERDAVELQKAAHSIKGSAGQLHALRLQQQALALEMAAHATDWKRIEALIPPLRSAEMDFLREIQQYADQ